jgi:hypothetical protein
MPSFERSHAMARHAFPVAPPEPPVAARARVAAIALAGAALAIVIGFTTKAWFSAGADGHVGLLGVEACARHSCRSMSWFAVKHVPAQIPWFAVLALASGAVALGFIIHAIAMLVRGTPGAIKLRWIAQTLGIAAMGATAFVVALSIGDPSRGLSIAWGAFVGLGGIAAAGAVTAYLVRPLAR